MHYDKKANNHTMSITSEINHEYYLDNSPGYTREVEEIINARMVEDDEHCGYQVCEPTPQMLHRVAGEFELVLLKPILIMMDSKSLVDNTRVHIKAALKNEHTGRIHLVTSSNRNRIQRKQLEKPMCRTYKTAAEGWTLTRTRMTAPAPFWRELQKILQKEEEEKKRIEEKRREEDFALYEKLFFIAYFISLVMYLVSFWIYLNDYIQL